MVAAVTPMARKGSAMKSRSKHVREKHILLVDYFVTTVITILILSALAFAALGVLGLIKAIQLIIGA